jgi:hypothetical protein
MKLLRDPLFHFVVLGAVLFFVYAMASGLFAPGDVRRIEIDGPTIEFLAGTFERQWGRPPMPEELQGLVRSRVREEVLYREALAVGLDRNDAVVRRRMVQKMELLSQDLALLADPTDAELRAFHAENIDDYRVPPRISFSHVYFNVDRRGTAAEDDARRVLADLRAQDPPPPSAPELGDRLMLETDHVLRSPDQVRQMFGSEFSEALFELEPGWHGPVVSSYGIHLVNVIERLEGRLREIDEIRDRLVNDFNRMRRDRANEALYEGLAKGYEVVIAGETIKTDNETGLEVGRE